MSDHFEFLQIDRQTHHCNNCEHTKRDGIFPRSIFRGNTPTHRFPCMFFIRRLGRLHCRISDTGIEIPLSSRTNFLILKTFLNWIGWSLSPQEECEPRANGVGIAIGSAQSKPRYTGPDRTGRPRELLFFQKDHLCLAFSGYRLPHRW